MATAGDQINAALRLIGQLAEGETPSSEASADALSALNQMLDSWSATGLSVHAVQTQHFTFTATATRTIGPTGQLVGNRPVSVQEAYYIVNNESISLTPITQEEYDAIGLKSLTSANPEYILVNMTAPNITVTLYPAPTASIDLYLVSVVELTQPATLATSLSVPPGYLRAFKYNLAVEIAAEFGIEPPPTVQRIAASSMRILKRQNTKPQIMDLPIQVAGKQRGNIFAG